MDETQFNQLAEQELNAIETAVSAAIDRSDLDCDVQLSDGGILEIELPQGKVVVNRHAAMQEIWLAARSGAHHFRYTPQGWVDTRDSRLLRAVLTQVLLTQSSGSLVLDAGWAQA